MRPEDRIPPLEELLAEDPSDHLTHFLLGREYLECRRFADAVKVLGRCVELEPRYTAAYRFLGDAHRKAGQSREAADTYRKGIAMARETGDLQAGREMQVFLDRLPASTSP